MVVVAAAAVRAAVAVHAVAANHAVAVAVNHVAVVAVSHVAAVVANHVVAAVANHVVAAAANHVVAVAVNHAVAAVRVAVAGIIAGRDLQTSLIMKHPIMVHWLKGIHLVYETGRFKVSFVLFCMKCIKNSVILVNF